MSYTTPTGLLTRNRLQTLEQKVEVLEDLVEHYQNKLEHTDERVRYLVATLEQLQHTDSGVQILGG